MAQRGKSDDASVHRGSGVGEHHEGVKPSDIDAMGQDKRRQVVGHSYGPSRKSQFVTGIIVGAILILGIGGYALAIAAFDQPQDEYPDEAVWKESTIPTRSPSSPCGEPGNPYPPPEDSPCAATGVKGQDAGKQVSDQQAVEESGATGAQ